jgi:hypothetical protein
MDMPTRIALDFASKVRVAKNTPPRTVQAFVALFSTADVREDLDPLACNEFFKIAIEVVGKATPHGQAFSALWTFVIARRGVPLAFFLLDRARIGVMAVLRILEPASMRQQRTDTCGPTAFIIDLCRRDPLSYAKLIVSLAESGRAMLGTIELRPGTQVTSRAATQLCNMAQADWIAIVSMRDTISAPLFGMIAHLDGKEIWERGVNPSDIYEWLVACGYGTVALIGVSSGAHHAFGLRTKCMRSINNSFPGFAAMGTSERDSLALADLGIKQGWSVFLLINAKLDTALQAGTQAHKVNAGTVGEAPQPLQAFDPMDRQRRLDALDACRDQLNAAMRQVNERFEQSTEDTHHCMLLLDLEVGKYLVSCTVANRGEVMYHHSLPLKTFLSCLDAVVVATDR